MKLYINPTNQNRISHLHPWNDELQIVIEDDEQVIGSDSYGGTIGDESVSDMLMFCFGSGKAYRPTFPICLPNKQVSGKAKLVPKHGLVDVKSFNPEFISTWIVLAEKWMDETDSWLVSLPELGCQYQVILYREEDETIKVLINPKITYKSPDLLIKQYNCNGTFRAISRPSHITIEHLNKHGEKLVSSFYPDISGNLQHQMDILNDIPVDKYPDAFGVLDWENLLPSLKVKNREELFDFSYNAPEFFTNSCFPWILYGVDYETGGKTVVSTRFGKTRLGDYVCYYGPYLFEEIMLGFYVSSKIDI